MENLQVRCSSLFKLMSKPKTKSKAQLYQETVKKLEEESAKYEAIANKTTKTAQNKLAKLSELTAQAGELEPFKDTWELSTTAKTWIKETAKETFYGFHKQIETKYMDKGHQNEDEAIAMLAEIHGADYVKNEERKTLTWLTGEADIVDKENGVIIDIKNAWDLSTFPAFKEDVNKKVKEAGYDWQQKGYLILWKLKKAYVCYCITETPAELIPDWEDETLHQVNHIAPEKRISISDEITITKEEIAEIKKAYKAANVYFKECLTELKNK